MSSKVKMLIGILIFIIICVSFAFGFFVGNSTINRRDLVVNEFNNYGQTFYATIESLDNSSILVKGLDINDINFRGEFKVPIDIDTKLLWRNTEINYDDLKVGQNVSITSIGGVLETYPAKLEKVTSVIVLDDELKVEKDNVNKTNFTKTYNVLNIADSNDGNYLYLTIRQFQVDEVETVKVLKSLASSVEVNKNYKFTFKYTNKKIEDNIKSIFENAMLEEINKTDKTGLEQVQDEI